MTETKHGPFDLSGITRDAMGVAHYDGLRTMTSFRPPASNQHWLDQIVRHEVA